MNLQSTFLTASPSWKDAGRLLDLAGTYDDYNRSVNPDVVALRMDARAVGVDFWTALGQLVSELSELK